MKMKLSIIAAVLASAFAVQANAAITTFSGFGDQLFLSVWDATAQTSYTRGLGLTINQMVSGAGINFGSATNGSGFSASGDTNSYSLAADGNLTSFLSAAAAAGDTVNWSVVGGDVPASVYSYGANGFAFTSTGAIPTISDSTAQGMNGFPGIYLNAVNNLMPSGSVAGNLDSISTNAATGGVAYVLSPTNEFGNNFGGSVTFSNAATLGNTLDFNLITATTGSRGYNGNMLSYQFSNASGASTWTLGTNGTLTYATASVAAVPEPSEIGLMVSGFGLVGFLANKRRKALKGK